MSRFSRQLVMAVIAEEAREITQATQVTVETDPATLKSASEFLALGKQLALKRIGEMVGVRAVDAVRRDTSGLDHETRETVDTLTAAKYINKEPGTLRRWSSAKNGAAPIRPAGKIGVDLAWRVADLRDFASGKRFRPIGRDASASRDVAAEQGA